MDVQVVAEIGCNHNGEILLATEMIRRAAKAGATFAKFQYYSTEEIKAYELSQPSTLYTPELFEQIKKTELSLENLKYLSEECWNAGINFLCTPFINPKRVKELDPLVSYWKIRERDSENQGLINAVLRTRKPVFISAQAMPLNHTLLFHPRITWLYCCPQYPAPLDSLNLSRVASFGGYSNHVPYLLAPLAATIAAHIRMKSRWVVEVHVKPDPPIKVIDYAVSFTFEELDFLIQQILEVLQCQVSKNRHL